VSTAGGSVDQLAVARWPTSAAKPEGVVPPPHPSSYGVFTRGRRVVRYLSSLDIRRSANGRPPVWQVGQYCIDLVANET